MLNKLIIDTFEATNDRGEFGAAIEEVMDALDGLSSSLSVVSKAFEDFSDDGELSYSTLSDIYNAFSDVSGIEIGRASCRERV